MVDPHKLTRVRIQSGALYDRGLNGSLKLILVNLSKEFAKSSLFVDGGYVSKKHFPVASVLFLMVFNPLWILNQHPESNTIGVRKQPGNLLVSQGQQRGCQIRNQTSFCLFDRKSRLQPDPGKEGLKRRTSKRHSYRFDRNFCKKLSILRIVFQKDPCRIQVPILQNSSKQPFGFGIVFIEDIDLLFL